MFCPSGLRPCWVWGRVKREKQPRARAVGQLEAEVLRVRAGRVAEDVVPVDESLGGIAVAVEEGAEPGVLEVDREAGEGGEVGAEEPARAVAGEPLPQPAQVDVVDEELGVELDVEGGHPREAAADEAVIGAAAVLLDGGVEDDGVEVGQLDPPARRPRLSGVLKAIPSNSSAWTPPGRSRARWWKAPYLRGITPRSWNASGRSERSSKAV